MLLNLDKIKIDWIPHSAQYEIWKARLTEDEFKAIVDQLNSQIDGEEVRTSSWMPGSDWSNTVFQPIYDRACGQHHGEAAKCFGLILWEVMTMRRGEAWSFGRYEKDGIPIEGLSYFRLSDLDHLCAD